MSPGKEEMTSPRRVVGAPCTAGSGLGGEAEAEGSGRRGSERAEAAPGPDGITPRALQELCDQVKRPLGILYRRALREGSCPEDWRTANVTPIYKKGAKGKAGNYRPVSLTSVPGKILESIIKDRLMEHLLENSLIKKSQHGFMPGRSCTTNLIEFMDKVTRAVDDGKAVDVFYLDFAKAFDKVPKERLLKKLEAKGVGGEVLGWIKAWLTDRKQRVTIRGQSSCWREVLSGVPQGSVLGPCLFAVFIDDLEDEIMELELATYISKFADDTKGMKVIAGEEDRVMLQRALDSMAEWAERWGMEFNVNKCKIMHLGKNNPEFEYFLYGTKLAVTEEEKDVGVQINKNLKPANHCKRVSLRAEAVLKQITRNFHYRDRRTFIKLYKQYVRPHLEFASPAWSPWTQADKQLVEKVQEKALKMVTGLVGRSYEERCLEVGLQTLERRRWEQDMVEVYRILRRGDEDNARKILPRTNGGNVRTRLAAGAMNLAKMYSRTDLRKNSFAVRVTDAWNSLDDGTKEALDMNKFKKMLKNHN